MKKGYCLLATERSGSTYVADVISHYLQHEKGYPRAPYEPFNIEASSTWHGPDRQPVYEISREEALERKLTVPYFICRDGVMTEVSTTNPLPADIYPQERIRRINMLLAAERPHFFKLFGRHVMADPELFLEFMEHYNVIILERDWLQQILSSMLTSYSGIYHSRTEVTYAEKFTAERSLFEYRWHNLLAFEKIKKRVTPFASIRYEDVCYSPDRVLAEASLCRAWDWSKAPPLHLFRKVNQGNKLAHFTNPDEILQWYWELAKGGMSEC